MDPRLKYATHGKAPDRPSFICPVCGKTSYHPKDIEHRYCGNCHLFMEATPWGHWRIVERFEDHITLFRNTDHNPPEFVRPQTFDDIHGRNKTCLTTWAHKLAQFHARPLMLLGMGQDHNPHDLPVILWSGSNRRFVRGFLQEILWAMEDPDSGVF